MPSMTVRNLSEDLHRRIRPAERLGDIVAAYARARAVDFPEPPRDRTPVSPADFS